MEKREVEAMEMRGRRASFLQVVLPPPVARAEPAAKPVASEKQHERHGLGNPLTINNHTCE